VTFEFGPFRLDADKRRLWRGDEVVALTPKAADTLLVLVSRAGQIVEKDDLLKAVWPDTFVEEVTLAQNISTLRRALGDNSETPTYIATVPRRGYRFLGPVVQTPHVKIATESVNPPGSAPPNIASATRNGRAQLWMAAAAIMAVALATIALWAFARHAPSANRRVVFAIAAPEGTAFSTSGAFMTVSPDGRFIAFLASGADGADKLWIRPIDSPDARALAGTEGASQPFWSGDSRFLAFFTGGKLKKIDVMTGASQPICDASSGSQPLAGTWNGRNEILFSSLSQGILHVDANGGVATVAVPNRSDDEHLQWPQFLPDGQHFLYVVSSTRQDQSGIYVGTLNSNERSQVVNTHSYAMYSSSGHLLFIRGGTLVAQPFDLTNFRVTGEAVPLADGVTFNAGTARATFSISNDGVLAYRTAAADQLTWFDRSGNPLRSIGPAGVYRHFAIAPNGTRVAAARIDLQKGTSDVWIFDDAEGANRRLTFEPSWERAPVWSPDGSRIAFSSDRTGHWGVYEKATSGERPEQPIVAAETSTFPEEWLSDGRLLLREYRYDRQTKGDFWTIVPGTNAAPIKLPASESDVQSGRISPDGRLLAYESWDDGRWSIFVRPLQATDTRWQISPAGSVEPRWRADGRELFFLAPDMALMAIDVEAGSTFKTGAARRLFQTRAAVPSGLTGPAYDASSDGQRFLIKVPASSSQITVVINWTSTSQRQR